MLYNGKKMILESIKNDSQKKVLAQKLTNQLKESNSLALEYLLINEVSKYENKLTLQEAKQLFRKLNEKFGQTLKNATYDFVAKKKLLESFGLDIAKIKKTKFDELVDFETKKINESVLRAIVVNPSKKPINESIAKKIKSDLFESYSKNSNSAQFLRERIRKIKKAIVELNESDAKIAHSCLDTIREGIKKGNIKKSANQLFKLNTLVETKTFASNKSLITEDDELETLSDNKRIITRRIPIDGNDFLRDVLISTQFETGGDFSLNFKFTIYPVEPGYTDRCYELLEIRDDLPQALERKIDAVFDKHFRGHFVTESSNFEIALKYQQMEKDLAKTNGAVHAKGSYVCEIGDPLYKEEYEQEFGVVIDEIAEILKNAMPDKITNEIQIQRRLEGKGKAKKQDERKIFKTKHGEIRGREHFRNKDNNDRDAWIRDMFMTGVEDDGLDD